MAYCRIQLNICRFESQKGVFGRSGGSPSVSLSATVCFCYCRKPCEWSCVWRTFRTFQFIFFFRQLPLQCKYICGVFKGLQLINQLARVSTRYTKLNDALLYKKRNALIERWSTISTAVRLIQNIYCLNAAICRNQMSIVHEMLDGEVGSLCRCGRHYVEIDSHVSKPMTRWPNQWRIVQFKWI